MTRLLLTLATGMTLMAPVTAGPPKINRTIGREPAYKTGSPRYGLLVFGLDDRDRVWLVLDGDALYVDRNGNGDLTDPGEQVRADKRPGGDPSEDGYSFDVGALNIRGQVHQALRVWFVPLKQYADGELGKRPEVKTALARDPRALAAYLGVDVQVPGIKGGGVGGRVAGPNDQAGILRFADTPAEAPVIHLGGPLQVTFYDQPTLRAGREHDLVLIVGTPGIGPGTFASIGYEGTVPENAKPVAEVTFPAARAGDPPIRARFEIKDRC